MMKKSYFTILEILASMSVFLILMVIMFQFIGSAQRAWTASNASTEVYQNARILFDVLARDLQGAVAKADDIPGSDLKFKKYADNDADGHKLAFVSAIEEGNGQLVEVAYKLDGNEILRAFSTSNPYGNRSDYDSLAGAATGVVVDGVLAATVVCFDSEYSSNIWSGSNIETTVVPDAVKLTVTLLDSKSYARWKVLSDAGSTTAKENLENERARTVSKTIFLGGR